MNLQINPNEYYSVRSITNSKFLPWFKSHKTLTLFLKSEKGFAALAPVVKQTARCQKYYIKGSTLIDFIESVSAGKITL